MNVVWIAMSLVGVHAADMSGNSYRRTADDVSASAVDLPIAPVYLENGVHTLEAFQEIQSLDRTSRQSKGALEKVRQSRKPHRYHRGAVTLRPLRV